MVNSLDVKCLRKVLMVQRIMNMDTGGSYVNKPLPWKEWAKVPESGLGTWKEWMKRG